MKYKRKKTKEKKLIEYGTPKEYQGATHNSNSSPAKKPSWYCKKLKGKHEFVRTGAEPVKLMNSDKVFLYKKCNGCFKQKIEITTREELQKEIDGTKTQAGVL